MKCTVEIKMDLIIISFNFIKHIILSKPKTGRDTLISQPVFNLVMAHQQKVIALYFQITTFSFITF